MKTYFVYFSKEQSRLYISPHILNLQGHDLLLTVTGMDSLKIARCFCAGVCVGQGLRVVNSVEEFKE